MIRPLALTISASLMVASLATVAFGQTRPPQAPSYDTDQGVGVGALGGLTRTSFTFNGESDLVDAANGFMAGIWFGGNRNGRVGFMGEISYVAKNGREPGGPGEIKLTYLEIPAVFRVNLGSRTREGASFYVVLGPVVDIKVKATEDGEDVGDFYGGVDLGVLGGAGVEVNRLGVEVRGNWGLRNFALPSEAFDEVKTFSLQFVAKFRFN